MVILTHSLIFFVFRKKWSYIFNQDPAVAKEVAYIMPLVAMFQIFDGLGSVTGAILRAKGQQDVGALLNFIGYYIIGIPLGLLLAFKFGMGLMGLWLGLTVALTFCAFSGLYSKLLVACSLHFHLPLRTIANVRFAIPQFASSVLIGRRKLEKPLRD
jgi:MATE family multidrug resistance protein